MKFSLDFEPQSIVLIPTHKNTLGDDEDGERIENGHFRR
jgi:hypothetical protein